MKVLLATHDFENLFRAVYPDLEVYEYDRERDRCPNWEGDILIFTGGEDINPRKYNQMPNGTSYWNDERDSTEENVWYLMMEGIIKVNKVLGVCRGIQILNVLMGGSLYQDLHSLGKGHHGGHEIKWQPGVTELLTCFSQVNSMHHQAVRTIGDSRRYKILATEPNTKVIESVLWARSRGGDYDTLGVQFHPEFFSSDLKSRFFNSIEKWIGGGELFEDKKSLKKEKDYKEYFKTKKRSLDELRASLDETRDSIENGTTATIDFSENIWTELSAEYDPDE